MPQVAQVPLAGRQLGVQWVLLARTIDVVYSLLSETELTSGRLRAVVVAAYVMTPGRLTGGSTGLCQRSSFDKREQKRHKSKSIQVHLHTSGINLAERAPVRGQLVPGRGEKRGGQNESRPKGNAFKQVSVACALAMQQVANL